MNVNDKSTKVCSFCDRSVTKECEQCENKFCCDLHYRMHMFEDSEICFPFAVKETEKVGRFIVANRDIEAGETVLENDPIIYGPNHEVVPECLECLLATKNSYRCSNCGFPMCDEACENAKTVHSVEECQALAKDTDKMFEQDSDGVDCENYHLIMPLRLLLLKNKDPDMFAFTRRLMDHDDKRDDSYREMCREKVVDRIRKRCGLEHFSEQEVFRAVGILDINSFEIHCSMVNAGFRGIYPLASLLSHSCLPNTIVTFNKKAPYRAKCVAVVKITKGQEILTKYVSSTIQSAIRRPKLRSGWHFDCMCTRCLDRSEKGSHVGTIICQHCKKDAKSSFMLQTDPLDENSPWRCDTCLSEVSAVEVLGVVKPMLERIIEIAKTKRYDVQAFMDVYLEAIDLFHPFHQVICELSKWMVPILCRARDKSTDDFSTEDLKFKAKLAGNQIKVCDIINPGLNKVRGKYLFECLEVSIYLTLRSFNECKISVKEFTKLFSSYIDTFEEVKSCLRVENSLTGFEAWMLDQADVLKTQCNLCISEFL